MRIEKIEKEPLSRIYQLRGIALSMMQEYRESLRSIGAVKAKQKADCGCIALAKVEKKLEGVLPYSDLWACAGGFCELRNSIGSKLCFLAESH